MLTLTAGLSRVPSIWDAQADVAQLFGEGGPQSFDSIVEPLEAVIEVDFPTISAPL